MTQTKESFTKDVNIFFDYFNEFEAIAHMRSAQSISNHEILPLFKIFMNHHKYVVIQK